MCPVHSVPKVDHPDLDETRRPTLPISLPPIPQQQQRMAPPTIGDVNEGDVIRMVLHLPPQLLKDPRTVPRVPMEVEVLAIDITEEVLMVVADEMATEARPPIPIRDQIEAVGLKPRGVLKPLLTRLL